MNSAHIYIQLLFIGFLQIDVTNWEFKIETDVWIMPSRIKLYFNLNGNGLN